MKQWLTACAQKWVASLVLEIYECGILPAMQNAECKESTQTFFMILPYDSCSTFSQVKLP